MTSRRSILAGLVATPVAHSSASALPAHLSGDARLVDMARRLYAAHGSLVELYDRSNLIAAACYANEPPQPETLRVTKQDRHDLLMIGRDEFFDVTDICRLRKFAERERTSGRVAEILGAWEAWEAACQESERAAGLHAADEASSLSWNVFTDLLDGMQAQRADSVRGLAAKVAVADFIRTDRVTNGEDWKGLLRSVVDDIRVMSSSQGEVAR